jgi:hypothetical protein
MGYAKNSLTLVGSLSPGTLHEIDIGAILQNK